MSNPLLQALGGLGGMPTGGAPVSGNVPMMGGPMAGMMQALQNFQQFRQTFRGNPEEEINKMMQSGQINPQQLEQAKQYAQMFAPFLR